MVYVVGAVLEPQEVRKNKTPNASMNRNDFIFVLSSVGRLLHS
jgi:hypothetical protein